jgi:hypothetical protein
LVFTFHKPNRSFYCALRTAAVVPGLAGRFPSRHSVKMQEWDKYPPNPRTPRSGQP